MAISHDLVSRRSRSFVVGVPIDRVVADDIPAKLDALMRDGGQNLVTTPNPEMCVGAWRDGRFRAALVRASLAIPDGFGLTIAARMRGARVYRIPGREVVPRYIAPLAAENNYSVFLLGAADGVAARAAEVLKRQHSSLRIVGAESGGAVKCRMQKSEVRITPPSDSKIRSSFPRRRESSIGATKTDTDRSASLHDLSRHTTGSPRMGGDPRLRGDDNERGWRMDEKLLEKIRGAAPDILLVAFGHGKQETWIVDHLAALPSVRIAMGVGGTFDYLAGNAPRVPRFMSTLGLEWLWRLIRQPWRWRRILDALVVFPVLFVYDVMTNNQ